jgi:hypothetical protein
VLFLRSARSLGAPGAFGDYSLSSGRDLRAKSTPREFMPPLAQNTRQALETGSACHR